MAARVRGGLGLRSLSEQRTPWQRRRPLATACLTLMLMLMAGCAGKLNPPLGAVPEDRQSRIRRIADEYAAGYNAMFPGPGNYARVGPGANSLPDNSLAGLSAWHRREDAWLAELRDLDPNALWGRPEWATLGYLRTTLQASIAMRSCRVELWPAHQFGWQTWLLEMLELQPVGTEEARVQALARWRHLPAFLDIELANLREGLRLGYSAPSHNIERAIGQLDALLAAKSTESTFWGPAKRDADPSFRQKWQTLVEVELLPATRRYLAYLRAEYLPKARKSIAISANPNGAACYRAQIAAYATPELDPPALFQLGQEEITKREAKVLALARNFLGTEVPDLRAAKLKLDSDPRNRMADRAEVLALVGAAIERARAAAPRWFARVPQAPLILAPFSDVEARSHPNGRYEPAEKDGSQPARYRIDVTNLDELKRADLEHTAFHEGFPGHHLQMQLARELPGMHEYGEVAGVGAFIEGWARYGEGLAEEMGLYTSDLDRLGALALMPTGLVVDPGIHALGWSRERAIAYVTEKIVGFSPEATAAYVDRIAVWPGSMVSYGAGELTIRRLRSRAQAELGERFDLRAFHELVLSQGAITLPMLSELVARWIDTQKQRPS